MRLNIDCVRAILESIEKTTTFDNSWEYEKGSNLIADFSHEEIIYHVRQCHMSELVFGFQSFGGGDLIWIKDLTPRGHEFLANIRSNTIWNKIKEAAGSASLSILIDLSAKLVRQSLGL